MPTQTFTDEQRLAVETVFDLREAYWQAQGKLDMLMVDQMHYCQTTEEAMQNADYPETDDERDAFLKTLCDPPEKD